MSEIKHFPKQGKRKSKPIFSICRTRKFIYEKVYDLHLHVFNPISDYPNSKRFDDHILSKNDFSRF